MKKNVLRVGMTMGLLAAALCVNSASASAFNLMIAVAQAEIKTAAQTATPAEIMPAAGQEDITSGQTE